MKKNVVLMLVVFVLAALLLAACSSTKESSGGDENPPVPAPYKGKTNPVAGNQDAIAAGKATFAANCASCHGDAGKGDGAAGAALNPKPANLTELDSKVDTDDFLLWRISEGGSMAPFNSSMPAFKGNLSEEQIWQVVSFLRTISQ